ncbi:phosphatase PAP2 family protein [Rhodobacteraceae bacterium KMM 6894]|nr:phosphatase PAP2 family protein [Rhodobacteraceae bacterium KMM 6894]
MTMQSYIPIPVHPRAQAIVSSIGTALWHSRVVIVFTLGHLAIALGISAWLGVPFQSGVASQLLAMLKYFVPNFLIFLMAWRFGHIMLIVKPRSATRWFLEDLRTSWLDVERVTTGIIAFAALCFFASSFAFIKAVLPQLNPFSWDPTLAQLDRWLHGGTDPYVLLGPLLDTPLITTWLNGIYHFWFFLLYFITFMACFDRDNPLRRNTFLIGFVLTWGVGGNLLAILMSSGGPVYYEAFGYGDMFTPLMDKLHGFAEVSPVWALGLQEMLLDGYMNNGPAAGISAAPSMHLASSALMTCHAFAWRRWAGWLMVGFTVLIMMGSVHLGWHYAIDGYLGVLLGIAAWYAARAIARAFPTA